jgi:hypothetical protein
VLISDLRMLGPTANARTLCQQMAPSGGSRQCGEMPAMEG